MGLKQATDLRAWGPGSTADLYARVSLSTQAGHRHETKVHRGTLCPMFQETCCFHVCLGWEGRQGSLGQGPWRGQGVQLTACPQVPQEELSQTTLQVQVLSFKRFSSHKLLGELSLPLGTVDLHHVLEHWYQLGPPGTVEVRPLTAQLWPGPGLCVSGETEPPSPPAPRAPHYCLYPKSPPLLYPEPPSPPAA